MINRDGTHASIWQTSVDQYQPKIQSSVHDKYDVIIVGGGITGVTTAYECQKAGLKCLLLESNHLCYGTTGGTTAHINTLLDTPYYQIIKNFGVDAARLIAQGAEQAVANISENIRKLWIECGFRYCNAILFAQDEKQDEELDKIIEGCHQVSLFPGIGGTVPLNVEFKRSIKLAGQAKFHPVRYVHALANAFENLDGIILCNCPVSNISAGGKSVVKVQSAQGTFEATYAIYATHIPPSVNILHLRCTPYRSYAMAARLPDNQYPEDLMYDMHDPYHYYRSQEIDGSKFLIVGGNDHKTGHNPNTESPFLSLESHVRSHFEIKEITHRWSSQYFDSADGLPYIGQFPGNQGNILVATGFGGNGITYGTLAASILKDIILERKNPLIELLSPTRIKIVAGFKNFTAQNIDVFKQLINKLFLKAEASEFVEVAPGDAKIFKADGQNIGVYKDENGGIHAINATCTHMRCIVSWNYTEKSWDCPCHGARFSYDGKVLNGPADKDLDYANVELISAVK